MAFSAAVQVLVTLGILFVYTDQASAQFTGCFSDAGCSNSLTGFSSAEECCLSDAGMYYNDGTTCQQCIVYGWADAELVAAEAAGAHSVSVEYIKGTGGRLRLNIEVIHDTTSDGDIIVSSQVLLPPGNIDIFYVVDSIAQEVREEATLRLSLLAGNPPAGSFLRSDLRLIVDDSDREKFESLHVEHHDSADVVIEFNQVDYAENERLNMSVTVRKLLPIANPVELLITPLTVEQYFAMPIQDRPELEEGQLAVLDNTGLPFSPNRAIADEDFSPDTISITFEADSEGGRVDDISVSIPLFDDEIDEADPELIVLILSVVSAVNSDGYTLQRPASVGMIADNDEIVIGFEIASYTFGEPPFETEVTDVRLVKENNVITEQTYTIVVSALPNVPPNSGFTPATRGNGSVGSDFDISGSETTAGTLITIGPNDQSISVEMALFSDDTPEGTEAFQLTSSPVTVMDNLGPQYTPASSDSDVFASTFVVLEDDDRIIIGWEQDYVVDENVGSFNACYIVIAPPILDLVMLVDTFSRTADESDYTPISSFNFDQERTLPAGEEGARACVTVTINDDNRYENDETFVIMLVPLSPGPILNPINTTITIRDTTAVTVGFIDPPYSTEEADGANTTFRVGVISDIGSFDRDITLSFSTMDGTGPGGIAVSGNDYISVSNRAITLGAGMTLVDIPVDIVNDNTPEALESFYGNLVLVGDNPRVTVDPAMARADISDGQGYVIGFERTNYTVPESDGMVEVCAKLISPGDEDHLGDAVLTFLVDSMDGSAESPADFGEIGGDSADITLTFNDATRRVCFNVMISVDNVYEPDEMFYLDLIPVDMLDNVDVKPDSAHVEITDTTDLTIGFINDPYTSREDQGPMVFMVGVIGDTVIDDDTEVMVTFSTQNDTGLNLAVAGVDYTTTGRTLTFDSETSLVNVDVPITNDDIYEGDESFQGNLVLADDSPRVTVSPDEAVATILDEDVITIGFIDPPYSALENEGPIVFTVGVIGGTVIEGTQVDVSFTTQDATSEPNQATAGVDYTSNSGQTLTFNPVTSTLTVSVPINDDNIFEPDEVFLGDLVTNSDRVVLSPDQAVATILNDEEQCLPLPAIPNGFILYSNDLDDAPNYDVGSIATYMCNVGFTLIGNDNRECVDGGNLTAFFNRQAPFCQPQCNPLPDLLNGDINYADDMTPNYVVGTIATYMCNDGFTLIGNVDRECVDDGDSTASFNRTVPYCRPRCLELPLLANGVITYGPDNESDYEVGTIATYMCNSGFTLVGEFTDRECVDDGDSTASFNREAPMCQVLNIIRVNDTVIGDPLMTVPLYVQDKSSIMPLGEEDIVHLCFEVHGRADEYFNLVSDEDVSVNAHYERVQPDEDINIIDIIAVRAVDSAGGCHNITVDLDQCRASVDGITISDMYSSNEISVRRYPRRVRISVPNGGPATGLVMWVFCQTQTFWSTSRTNPDGSELTFQGDAIRFVIARGLNLLETSHGILGQFWNVPIDVAPYTGPFVVEPTDGVLTYNVTVNYPNQPPRHFIAWLQFPSWELERRMYCLYAGDAHASFIYEVPQGPVNGPVIEGTYQDYITSEQFDTEFEYTHFDASQCP